MTQQHQAAFLDGVNQPLRVGPTDTPKPGPGELLIKTAAVAINPIDWKIQGSGMFIKTWPTILGLDLAGEVFAVGDGVTAFAKGQRVIAYSQLLPSLNIDRAAYQEFVIAPQAGVAPLPDSVPYEAGVVLPLAVSTAAAGLFPSPLLGLDTPSVPPAKKNGKTLLVWGASSSVGATAIQLAVAAGYDVVATASRSNFDLVRGLGAKVVLDYHSSSIVEDLVAELKKGGGFVGAYDGQSMVVEDPNLGSIYLCFTCARVVMANVFSHHLCSDWPSRDAAADSAGGARARRWYRRRCPSADRRWPGKRHHPERYALSIHPACLDDTFLRV